MSLKKHLREVTMQSYTHFTLEERESLRILLESGKSLRSIAETLGRSPSSVSRELRRNCNKTTKAYNSWGATSSYLRRRKRCRRPSRFALDEELLAFTKERLEWYWPPETIAQKWNETNSDARVSHTTIYRALRNGLIPACSVKKNLRRRGWHRYTRGDTTTIKPERLIAQRCAVANDRLRLGDLEGDLILGGTGKGCLLVFVDRKSRYVMARVLLDKSAATVRTAFRHELSGKTVHTITLDNGSEFAAFREIERDLNTEIYFCNPRSPWQRGTIENQNGLLRFFFQKGCDFRTVSQAEVDHVLSLINLRPRKCLGWLSPSDFFLAKCCT